MKKVLIPLGERDYETTQRRVGHLIESLSKTLQVEIITNGKAVYDNFNKRVGPNPNVTVKFVEAKFMPLTFDFRDNLAKIFVR